MSKVNSVPFFQLALVFFLLALVIGFVSYKAIISGKRFLKLPTVTGRILSIEIKKQPYSFSRSSGSGGISLMWMILVEYEYTVEGKKYIGHRLSNREYMESVWINEQPSIKLTKYLERYPVGKAVDVRYYPKDPQWSLLDVDTSDTGIIILVNIVAFLIPLSLLYMHFKRR
jgi:hypothetical protein